MCYIVSVFPKKFGRPFISSEKIASKGMMKLAQISDLYDVIVVSEDYFDFYEYVKDKFFS